jgi:thermitase
MILGFSIFFLGCWIISKNNIQLAQKIRLLFFLSLAILIASSILSGLPYSGIFLFLAISFFTLAFIGFVLDLASINRSAQIILLILSVFMGYFISETLNKNSTTTLPMMSPDPKGEILMEIDKDQVSMVRQFATKNNATISRAFHPINGDLTTLDDYYLFDNNQKENLKELLSQLENTNGVKWIEYNEIVPFESPGTTEILKSGSRSLSNDPSVIMQWHLSFLEIEKYYQYIKGNSIKPQRTAKLYILDTGIDTEHEDLPKNKSFQKDKNGHGTHCAGVAAAVTNNSIGVASMSPGMEWIDVYGIQVIGDVGFGTQKSIIDGIIKAADDGADVISMSLGGITNQEREKAYNDAVRYANDKGAIVVVAAGNANLDGKRYSPANAENVITVTAVNEKMEKSGFSNHVQNVKMGISAPGERILSTTPSNTYTSFNGTSMATPQVAGLIAVMKAINPRLDTKAVFSILNSTGKETQNTIRTGKLIQPYDVIKTLVGK